MFLYIFHYQLKNTYNNKKILFYQKRNINKPLFKSFQHRAKVSLKMKGKTKKDSHKNKIIASCSIKGLMPMVTKRKISLANKGKAKTSEFKKKISIALKGRKISPEHKLKLKHKLSGYRNPRFGKRHTKFSKRKISISMCNKKILNSC
jgi:hypothetical protein